MEGTARGNESQGPEQKKASEFPQPEFFSLLDIQTSWDGTQSHILGQSDPSGFFKCFFHLLLQLEEATVVFFFSFLMKLNIPASLLGLSSKSRPFRIENMRQTLYSLAPY